MMMMMVTGNVVAAEIKQLPPKSFFSCQ